MLSDQDFAAAVVEIAGLLRMSVRQTADEIGASASTFQRWKKGRVHPIDDRIRNGSERFVATVAASDAITPREKQARDRALALLAVLEDEPISLDAEGQRALAAAERERAESAPADDQQTGSE